MTPSSSSLSTLQIFKTAPLSIGFSRMCKDSLESESVRKHQWRPRQVIYLRNAQLEKWEAKMIEGTSDRFLDLYFSSRSWFLKCIEREIDAIFHRVWCMIFFQDSILAISMQEFMISKRQIKSHVQTGVQCLGFWLLLLRKAPLRGCQIRGFCFIFAGGIRRGLSPCFPAPSPPFVN